ncbi:MAG: precorrin-4 C(11)-methyltransferase [Desulfovibrionaceae bacterium]|nr:precorrin-4 C(11)-methyltransferase [Desulfovibrionaceae bacterium]
MQNPKNIGKVYFIGAGPGDPELLTLKAARIIEQANLLIYAGSLVPKSILNSRAKGSRCFDSATLNLEEISAYMAEGVKEGGMVARIHTGDPSLYGALREECQLLKQAGIAFEVIPGVTAATAAAAKAAISFTVPEVSQTLIITRLAGRTPMPREEELSFLATHHCSLAIYLSSKKSEQVAKALLAGGYSEDTPILCAHRVGWPEERLLWTTLAKLGSTISANQIERQTVILVLPAEQEEGRPSRLYAREFSHSFRKGEFQSS